MIRYALISDLHGNEVALRSVLDHIDRHGVDQVVCLGDVATLGPRPGEVIELIEEAGCVCVMGNHDTFLLDPDAIAGYVEAPVILDSVAWCRARLRRSDRRLLSAFRPTIELPLEGDGLMLACHGSPRSSTEDLLATTPTEEVEQMLSGHDVGVLACGHTHVQMLRQHRGRLLVNPGSVGLPFKEPISPGRAPRILAHAEYAVVESKGASIGITLHRVELDRAALRNALVDTDLPLRNALLKEYT